MKILCITSSYPITPGSNSGIFVKRLVDELAKENDVTVITPAYKNVGGVITKNPKVIAARYAPDKFQILCHNPGGIPVILKSDKRFFLAVPFLLMALFLKTLIHARQHDIIQANWAICGAIAGIVSILTKTPLITTLRGDDVNGVKKSIMNRYFLSIALAHSKAIVTVSNDIREQLINEFNIPAYKVLTIANGVNDEFLVKGQQSTSNGNHKQLTLITVGSLIPRKNISFLIKALSKLPSHVETTVVGNGEEKESLIQLSKSLKIDHRIHFLGARNPTDIPTLLAEHDAFILCSKSEGRSNAIYEAMACGKAIIASDLPGTKEQIIHEQTGYLFPLDSESHFIDLVIRLDKQRKLAHSVGKNAHQWIIENGYTWRTTKEQYIALFQRLLTTQQ